MSQQFGLFLIGQLLAWLKQRPGPELCLNSLNPLKIPGSMRKTIVTIIACAVFLAGNAQQYNTWYFGGTAGISFNPGQPTIPYTLTDGKNSANEGNASICDSNGHILFYTNGRTIYNKNHDIMLNGNNLAGHESAVQSSIIIPVPAHDSLYYVFTTDAVEDNFAQGYCYSIVNMNHDAGRGEVVTKNVLLNPSCTERLTAARHANGIDVWIIGNERSSNTFKAWLLTCNGLQASPVISTVGDVLNQHPAQNLGMMKVSPDGTQLCQTHFPDFDGLLPENFFQLFDFNNATGVLTNPKKISVANTNYHVCEFSPDSKLLYVTRVYDSLFDQFEPKLVNAAQIIASRVSIPAQPVLYGIQTGPDGKIYLNRYTNSLSVIAQPNVKGPGCNFQKNKVSLGNANGHLGLPSAINDGPVDPFNNFDFTVVDSCNGVVQFNGYTNMGGSLTWTWDFGDGTGSNIQNPVHTYTSTNTRQYFKVRLTVRSATACGDVQRTRELSPGGLFSKADFDIIAKCDSNYVRFVNKSVITPDGAAASYLWDFGDGNFSTQPDPLHTYAATGNFTIKLKISTGSACLDDSIQKGINLSDLNIQVPPSQTIDAGQTVQLYVTGGGNSFTWAPPQWLSDPNIENPVASPQDDITYVVTVTNDAGCKDVDSVSIHVNPVDGIYIPTAFTPGGDGLNDLLIPILGRTYSLKEFTIYNRWGQRVFTTNQAGKGWDGKLGNQSQPGGVYVWYIRVIEGGQKVIDKKGTVTLVR
jgi:gliding motility-associated-like protein